MKKHRTLKIVLAILATGLMIILLLAAFVVVRNTRAASQIEQDWETTQVAKMTNPGAVSRLSILPLYELDAASPALQTGHGVSYLIRTDQATILLDVGYNPEQSDPSPLQYNIERLGIDLSEVDALVISHMHPDHIGGMVWWPKHTFSIGNVQEPLPFSQVYTPLDMTYPGLTPITASQPMQIAPGIVLGGTIPFPELMPLSLIQSTNMEQSLVINVEGLGLVVVTGCGHPGIEKIISRAEALFDQPVIGIVGGLHYIESSAEQLQPHLEFIKEHAPQLQVIAPSPHDSGPQALQAIQSAFPAAYQQIQVGREIVIK
jgi:7,8-dihydropterin-6-yl-methyl-4-(beta-D-ribofuranosyl)aminobenzene 5'-phosphate synthase